MGKICNCDGEGNAGATINTIALQGYIRMITYDYELHARNIAAMNARNDDTEEQRAIDVRLAAELQRTLDRMHDCRKCGEHFSTCICDG